MAKLLSPVTTYTAIKPRKKLSDIVMDAESEWSPKKKSTAKRSKTPKKSTEVEPVKEQTVIEEPAELVETLEMFQMRTRIEEERKKQQEEEAKAIFERLSKIQPFLDHCYTSIFGPRVVVEAYGEGPQFEQEEGDEQVEEESPTADEEQGRVVTFQLSEESGGATSNSLHVPVIRMAKMPVVSEGPPAVGSEEVIQEADHEAEGDFVPTHSSK